MGSHSRSGEAISKMIMELYRASAGRRLLRLRQVCALRSSISLAVENEKLEIILCPTWEILVS